MNITQAIISGVVQGITEFFPVSSSGHLVILHNLFGLKEPLVAFDIFLHLGTVVAILIFFFKDILGLFTKDRKVLVLLILGSIPAFIIGFLFKDIFESLFGMPKVVGYMLGLTGGWLILGSIGNDYLTKAGARKDLGILNSIIIGIAQAIAIVPGISRSGATIATGMLLGLDKELAFRFSFLLAVPAILGASVFKAGKIGSSLLGSDMLYFAIGGITAMLVGLGAIKLLLRLVKNNQLYLFGIYCILLSAILICVK